MLQICVCMSMYSAAYIGFCESTKAWLTHLDKHGAEQLMAEHWLPLPQLSGSVSDCLPHQSLLVLQLKLRHTSVCDCGQLWQRRLRWGCKTHPRCWLCNGLIWCATDRASVMLLHAQVRLSKLSPSSKAGPPWRDTQTQGLAWMSSSGDFFVCLMSITYPLLLCFLNGCDLLGHHRQHLDINAVELIKTSPCASAGQGRRNEESQEHHTEQTCTQKFS